MAMLKNLTRGSEITPFVSLVQRETPRQVMVDALDGTRYLQSIGRPQTDYQLTAYVQPDGRNALDQAWWACDLLEVRVKRGTFRGRITAVTYGPRMAKDWYQATVTLAEEEE